MNFLNLQYFCTAAEELSFTKAARRLFISQQSLSGHISRLEAELGVVLFNRTQPMTLTQAGECLYRSSQVLLYQKKQVEKAIQDIRDFRSGELTVGVTTSRGAVMLSEILPRFHKQFPQITLRLTEGTTQQINRALYEGRSDLNVGFAIGDEANVCEELLYTEYLVCLVPRVLQRSGSGLFQDPPRQGMRYNFRSFAGYPFLKMPRSFFLGGIFEQCCRDHDMPPDALLETTSMTTLVSLCIAGLGAIVLPGIFTSRRMVFWDRGDWRNSVSIYPLDYEMGGVPITISYMRNHYLSRAALEFIRITKEIYAR